jgi:hypothetical protein
VTTASARGGSDRREEQSSFPSLRGKERDGLQKVFLENGKEQQKKMGLVPAHTEMETKVNNYVLWFFFGSVDLKSLQAILNL